MLYIIRDNKSDKVVLLEHAEPKINIHQLSISHKDLDFDQFIDYLIKEQGFNSSTEADYVIFN